MARKLVSFWARKPVRTKVCFRARGKKVCFIVKTPKKVRVKFRV